MLLRLAGGTLGVGGVSATAVVTFGIDIDVDDSEGFDKTD